MGVRKEEWEEKTEGREKDQRRIRKGKEKRKDGKEKRRMGTEEDAAGGGGAVWQ